MSISSNEFIVFTEKENALLFSPHLLYLCKYLYLYMFLQSGLLRKPVQRTFQIDLRGHNWVHLTHRL